MFSPLCSLRAAFLRLRAALLRPRAAIAALQSFILPDGTDYTGGVFFGRTVAWAGLSALAIFAVSLWRGWLAVPGWLPSLLLGAAMFAGLFAMLIGERFKQELETEQLNEALRRRRPAE